MNCVSCLRPPVRINLVNFKNSLNSYFEDCLKIIINYLDEEKPIINNVSISNNNYEEYDSDIESDLNEIKENIKIIIEQPESKATQTTKKIDCDKSSQTTSEDLTFDEKIDIISEFDIIDY